MKPIKATKARKEKKKLNRNANVLKRHEFEALALDVKAAVIQNLFELGLMVAIEQFAQEVEELAGHRYSRKIGKMQCRRHGTNPGTVSILGNRVAVKVPRVRDATGDVQLKTYQSLHESQGYNETIFGRVLAGLSCRDYERTAEMLPGAIGLSKSTISESFKKESAKKFKELMERDLGANDIVAIFIDGKAFGDEMMVIALGVDMEGNKHILGFVQTTTENSVVIGDFLEQLLDRGLDISRGVLAITDGSKGIIKAVRSKFKGHVVIQRCQWHKRENVASHLSKTDGERYRLKLQAAYNKPDYQEAVKALKKIRSELEELNLSAATSLDEGFEETLTLHRLGVFGAVGISFKTTNCLESINALVGNRCDRVDNWKNSKQKHRWLAASLLDIEPKLRKIKGYKHLAKLRAAIMIELSQSTYSEAA